MAGLIEKAIIELEVKEIGDIVEKETNTQTDSKVSGSISGITHKLKNAAANMAESALGDIISDIVPAHSDNELLEVQFNPVELSINASAKKSKKHVGIDKEHHKSYYGSLGVQVIVTIPLVFDESDTFNSLIRESVNKSNNLSIAEKVNLFINQIKNPNLRNIRFCWGTLTYEGQLYSVDAEYNMFDKAGNPLHANVNLQLLCKNGEDSYWDSICKKFKGKEG